MHISANDYLTLSLGNSRVFKKDDDTYNKASSGHLLNQSRVQQFTNDGNFLHLTLSESPTGDMHKHMCNLSLTLDTNV